MDGAAEDRHRPEHQPSPSRRPMTGRARSGAPPQSTSPCGGTSRCHHRAAAAAAAAAVEVVEVAAAAVEAPTPSEIDFEWTVKSDIEELDGEHDSPSGSWSDGALLWLLENGDGADDAIYAYDLKTGERVEDREFELDERNRAPRGVWSDRTIIWVSDSGQNHLFAHDLESGRSASPNATSHSPTATAPRAASGPATRRCGCSTAAMTASSPTTSPLATCSASTSSPPPTATPRGIWSDGVTVWVADHGAKRLLAYRLPARPEAPAAEDAEPQALERVSDEDFKKLSGASNNSPRGLWSDGDVMLHRRRERGPRLHVQHAQRDRRAAVVAHAQRRRHRRVLIGTDRVRRRCRGGRDRDDGRGRGNAAPGDGRDQSVGCRRRPGERSPDGVGGEHRDHRHRGPRRTAAASASTGVRFRCSEPPGPERPHVPLLPR